MTGEGIYSTVMRRLRGTRGLAPRIPAPAGGGHAAVVAGVLLVVLGLQGLDLRAELLFRSVEQVDGQRHWSAPRNYANPAETVYPRVLEDGSQVSAEEVQVFLQGDITQQDVYSAKVMQSLIKRGRQTLSGNTVTLAGSGGDADAAMEIGRMLRKLGVSTLVGRGDQCLSSCVFAFMGGDRRTVAGRIGIHRPYFSSTRKVPDRRSYYRQLQKRLQQYIEELDFPPSLYEAIMAVPPESINLLTIADLKKFYLQGMSPSAEDEADATAARRLGMSLPEYLQRKAQAEPCGGILDGERGCERKMQGGTGGSAAVSDPGIAGTPGMMVPPAGTEAQRDQARNEGPGATRGAASLPGIKF